MTLKQAQAMVRAFHEHFSCPFSTVPTLIPAADAEFRAEFIREELEEYEEAVAAGDLVGIADALGDLLYVVFGTAVEHGIELAPIFEEIVRSNTTKVRVPTAKKVGKDHNYSPPDLVPILMEQMMCEACEAKMRLTDDGIHYDDARGGWTWGVCRKVVARMRAART